MSAKNKNRRACLLVCSMSPLGKGEKTSGTQTTLTEITEQCTETTIQSLVWNYRFKTYTTGSTEVSIVLVTFARFNTSIYGLRCCRCCRNSDTKHQGTRYYFLCSTRHSAAWSNSNQGVALCFHALVF